MRSGEEMTTSKKQDRTTSAREPIDQPLRLDLDLDALEHNLRLIQDLAGPGQQMIAAIKANAYGHGCIAIARHLESLGVHSLATGSPAEARAIREAGVRLPILLLAATPPKELPLLAAAGLIPTVTSFEGAQALAASAHDRISIYIKVDIGLGRLGIPIDEAMTVIERIRALPHLRLEGLYTHAPFADETGRERAAARLQKFDALIANLRARGVNFAVTQARASSCVLAGLPDRCSAICVGHALYGLSPYVHGTRSVGNLRPVLKSLTTQLIQVVHHGQGADIGIAGLYSIERAKTIGVLAVGLGNGITRPAVDSDATVIVNGVRARILTVSLEHTTIELPDKVSAVVGDEVTLIGAQASERIDLESYSAWRHESPLQTLMHLSGRMG
jgi:alanine racemase